MSKEQLKDCPSCLEEARQALGIDLDLFIIWLQKFRTNGFIEVKGKKINIGKLEPIYAGLTGQTDRIIMGYSCPQCSHMIPIARYPAYHEWI